MRAFAGILLLLLLADIAPAAGQQPAEPARGGVSVDPGRVAAGMFFSGAIVRVSAVVPRGAAVAVEFLGEKRALKLKKKGKVLGLVWMNVDDVGFSDVPDLYLLRTSYPIQLASARLAEAGVGFQAISARAAQDSADSALFGELVRLKQRDRLWGEVGDSVQLRPAENGTALATTDFVLPASTPPGRYQVVVYAFRDTTHQVVGTGELTVQQAGLALFISSLAAQHGLLYGVLATVVAMAVGLLTGIVFGLGSKGHH